MSEKRTRIKICGMRRQEDIEYVNAVLPDYVGFIFAEGKRRTISEETARLLRSVLDVRIKPVGVFIDQSPEWVAHLLNSGVIEVAQLHGTEDEDYIATLRELTRKEIFQAFQIRSEEDIQKALASTADMLLLDSGTGSGVTFDWSLLENVDRQFILAGGLALENVSEAVLKIRPYGVDVSSGVETDGWKDQEKIRSFVEKVREISL